MSDPALVPKVQERPETRPSKELTHFIRILKRKQQLAPNRDSVLVSRSFRYLC